MTRLQNVDQNLQQSSGYNLWIAQWTALVRKHLFVILRSPFMLLLAVLGPALAMVLASITSKAIAVNIPSLPDTPYTTLAILKLKVSSCEDSTGPYPSYYYAPQDPYHSAIMNTFAEITSLKLNADIIGFPSSADMFRTFYNTRPSPRNCAPHLTITFNTFNESDSPSTYEDATQRLALLNTTAYTIASSGSHNFTYLYLYQIHEENVLALKVALDNAIIRVRRAQVNSLKSKDGKQLNQTTPIIDIYITTMPSVSAKNTTTLEDSDKSDAAKNILQDKKHETKTKQKIGSLLTTTIMSIGFFPMLLLISQVLGQEKHERLIGMLRKLSLFESAYWASVGVIIFLLALVVSIWSVIAAVAIGSSFYPYGNTDLRVIFLVQLCFALSLCSFGQLSVAISSQPYVTNILMIFLISGTVIGIIVFDTISFFSPYYETTTRFESMWLDMYTYSWKICLISLMPHFHYGRIMREIISGTGQYGSTDFYALSNTTITLGPFKLYIERDRYNEPYKSPNFVVFYASPAYFNLIGMAILFLVYLLLCCYLNQIVVGNNGGAKSVLFFLKASYWRNSRPANYQDESVVIQNLTKSFGKLKALNAISITMRKGRCLALLGHNGAGKTTLINILSSLIKPTSGDALILGHKLSQGVSTIQHDLGVCPQEDIHYPALSAREHLRLYACFEGVSGQRLNSYVEELLDIVGLLERADQMVGQYSGGMKRRLSIISAGIGNPKFVILDEPTTGMDPINRRKVWQYIAKMKRDCVLLLTSHSMEEADALGDEICILDHGEVQAIGSSFELKKTHGTGYQINLLTWPGKHADLETFVAEVFPRASLSMSSATLMSVVVKREDTPDMAGFLSTLQAIMRLPEHQRLVKDWGIQNASLEQVFMKLTKKPKDDLLKSKDNIDVRTTDISSDFEQLTVLFKLSTQIAAVVAKNFSFQKKQLKTNLFLFLAIIGLLCGMYAEFISNSFEYSICPQGYKALIVPLLNLTFVSMVYGGDIIIDSPRQRESCDRSRVQNLNVIENSLCNPSTSFLCDVPDYGARKLIEFLDNSTVEVWVQGASADQLETMRRQQATTFVQQPSQLKVLGNLLGYIKPPTGNSLNRPANFVIKNDTMTSLVYKSQLDIRAIFLNSTNKEQISDRWVTSGVNDIIAARLLRENFPDYALSFSNTTESETSQKLSTTIYYYARSRRDSGRYHFMEYRFPVTINRRTYIDTLGISFKGDARNRLEFASSGQANVIPLLNKVEAYKYPILPYNARTLVGSNETILTDYTQLTPMKYSSSINMITTIFVMMIFYLMFPVYIFIPFMEREQHLYNYYKANGLTTTSYWLGNYLFNLLLSLPIFIVIVISIKAYYVVINIGLLSLTLLLGLHSTIALAFFFASLVRSPIAARLVAYIVPVICSLTSLIVIFPEVMGIDPFVPTWASLFPFIALAFSLRLVLEDSGYRFLVAPLLLMFFVGLVCIVLSVLIANAPKELGRLKYFKGLLSARLKHKTNIEKTESSIDDTQSPPSNIDSEVLLETKRVDEMVDDSQLAVKIRHLSKYYGRFAAVNDLTLSLEKGECFGLLGPNGSGKTTTVSMLSGILTPSSGSAKVGGFDIVNPLLPSMIGLCPQHDCLIRDLTVEENLLFFARVRGASSDLANLHARHAATIVGLSGETYVCRAEHLSSGMRRRLNIAIALIGLPPVIILDEPTTGLDPIHRMQIWSIISQIRDRKNQCIILISHLMEEVDALTSRVGIMAAGSLRCLGNQVSLKNRFANGYSLYVQVNVECLGVPTEAHTRQLTQIERAYIDAVTDFVRAKASEEAVLYKKITAGLMDRLAAGEITYDNAQDKTAWTVSLQYRLPGDVHLGRLFRDMEKKAHEVNVIEWTLNQNSLEDVFLQVTSPFIKDRFGVCIKDRQEWLFF